MFTAGSGSSWGLRNRLSRIIKPRDGRTLMLAVDHGYFLGPIRGLENPRRAINPLLPYADAVMLTRGVLRTSIDPESDVPVVLRVSGGNTIDGPVLGDEEVVTSVEDAIRLNVSALAFSVYVGTQFEHQTLKCLAKLVDAGERYGIPILSVTAVGRELEKRTAKYIGLACRVSAELGAHFIKTYYTDDFHRVVDSVPVPLVIAGGPKLETDMDVLRLAYNAISEGAAGLDFGRNVFQNPNPVGMIKALRGIVHENMTPDEAAELLKPEKIKA
ncbi:MAG: 3-hydroxy-5-phosphonooxypentane-2,4-dione thiolase [Nitrososphaerota archaeon]|nr:3-hydroxy-5-phosphonooxypentane-2,4-dione thiolase [Candidatus Calditenuaceae archaeon]MDW8073573.1 3-hydroxy-5-phosphonooxypentane-2,4-dione thiolase [Nitrososphaerota archaeon]